ncbi:hypothetical protein RP20_CCG011224 [Aedes albopictus]|nr:hypothetical protein RP20_CCG011224 [Aedes albopictus]
MVRTLDYHAEDLGSNPTPDKLTKSLALALTDCSEGISRCERSVPADRTAYVKGYRFLQSFGGCYFSGDLRTVMAVVVIDFRSNRFRRGYAWEMGRLTLWARMEAPSEQASVTSTRLSSCSNWLNTPNRLD